MKTPVQLLLLTAAFQACTTTAYLMIPDYIPGTLPKPFTPQEQQQKPIMSGSNPAHHSSQGNQDVSIGDLSISDVIGKERVINIFAGFTRDIESISKRLDDSSLNTTILAPLNSELQKLPRKPWEDPQDYDEMGTEAYKGSSGEDRAGRNLRRFVEAHTIPVSPWKEGERTKSLRGEEVWWETQDGKKMVQPGNVEVSSIASRVSNGEVWIVKGCMNYT